MRVIGNQIYKTLIKAKHSKCLWWGHAALDVRYRGHGYQIKYNTDAYTPSLSSHNDEISLFLPKNHNTVAVSRHQKPTYLHCWVINNKCKGGGTQKRTGGGTQKRTSVTDRLTDRLTDWQTERCSYRSGAHLKIFWGKKSMGSLHIMLFVLNKCVSFSL